jgi:hypothetical protein
VESIRLIETLKKALPVIVSLDATFTNREFAQRSEDLKSKSRSGNAVSSRISVLFLISGIMSLIFSIPSESQILALIGLGLTFWAALFLLIKPVKLVGGSLLYSAAVSTYLTTDRIIKSLKNKGKIYYIPPYPKDVYLPHYLKALKEVVVFVSVENDGEMPPIEEIAKGKFMSEKPKGVFLAPPGSGLLTQIEEEFHVDFTKMDLNELCTLMPSFILQDLNLAKEMEMKPKKNQVHLRIFDSLYKNLYNVQTNLKSVNLLGCPIASAVACALAKTSGKTATIQKLQVSPDGLTIEVWYRIVQG